MKHGIVFMFLIFYKPQSMSVYESGVISKHRQIIHIKRSLRFSQIQS